MRESDTENVPYLGYHKLGSLKQQKYIVSLARDPKSATGMSAEL